MSFLFGAGVGGGAIPDSLINQYLYADFTTSNWPDSEGSLDLTTISGLQSDGTAFGGEGGVESSTAGDYAQDGQFTFLQNNYYSEWAVAFGFSTTDDGAFLWGINDVNNGFNSTINCDIGRDVTSGRLGISRRFGSNTPTFVGSDVAVNGGGEYVAIIQSTGPTASDLEIYFEPSVDSAQINQSGADGTGSESFNSTDMTYYARNDQGTIASGIVALMTDLSWFNASLTESERSNVFGQYSWYDPSTDAP
jgi:hypothetical protein